MPELPEVETIVRDLRPQLVGQHIVGVELIRASIVRFPDPEILLVKLQGGLIKSMERRGKFMHLGLDSGDDLVIHLGMTGTLTLNDLLQSRLVHTHLSLRLESGLELRYRDPRRFGRVLLGRSEQLQAAGVLPQLGVEPIADGFPDEVVIAKLRQSRRAVKSVLLDQSIIAGCGNIYADEACFLAQVRPSRPADSLTKKQARFLLQSLKGVMEKAITLRGTSFSDYRDGFGAKGEAFETLLVYGRRGQPCVRCGHNLQFARIGGRGTVYCERCQGVA